MRACRRSWLPPAHRLRGAGHGTRRSTSGYGHGTPRSRPNSTRRERQTGPQRRRGRNPAAGIEPPAPSTPGGAASAARLGMLPPGIEPPEEAPRRYTFQFASAKDWTKEADKGDD